jgi:hypothetical protein
MRGTNTIIKKTKINYRRSTIDLVFNKKDLYNIFGCEDDDDSSNSNP